MSGSRKTILWDKVGRLGLLGQAALVSAVVLAIWLLVAPIALSISGVAGVVAAAAGAAVCWIGAAIALATARLFHGPMAAMQSMVVGMLARTMFPLALGVALHFEVRWLAEAGIVCYLLIFYLVTMATETVLVLAQIPTSRAS